MNYYPQKLKKFFDLAFIPVKIYWTSYDTNRVLLIFNFFGRPRYINVKPGTLGDQSKPMTIRLDSPPFVGCRCPRVADANFAPGGRQYIGSHTDATDSTR
jgi:hypothetical protein